MTTALVLVLLLSIAMRILYKRHSRKLEKMFLGNSSRGSGRHGTKPFLRPANSGSSNNGSNGGSTRKDSDDAPEMFAQLENGSPVSTIIGGDDV